MAFFTKNGLVKRTNLSEYQNIRSIGVRAINLDENDELVTAVIATSDGYESLNPTNDPDIVVENELEESEIENILDSIDELPESSDGKMLFVVTKKGMCIKFSLNKVRQIGRVARGVTAIRFKEDGDEVVGAVVIENDTQEILSVSQKGIGKRTTADEYRLQSRGGKGVICMKLTSKTKDLVGVVMVDESMDLMALTSSGKMIRVDMQTIRKAGRNTSGVIVVNVAGDDVVSIARCPKEDNDNDEFDMLDEDLSDE